MCVYADKRHQSKFPQTPQLQYQRPKAHVYGGHKRAGQRGLVADDKTEEANMAVQVSCIMASTYFA